MKGCVYILSNPSMPGILKIGKTTRSVRLRADELYQTGVPTPFKVEAEFLSPNCSELEQWAHDVFAEVRVSDSREFFAIDVDKATRQIESDRRYQVELMLGEYYPDHCFADADLFVDPADICMLAFTMGVADPDVASAMSLITPEELEPAMARYRARDAMRLQEDSGISQIHSATGTMQ